MSTTELKVGDWVKIVDTAGYNVKLGDVGKIFSVCDHVDKYDGSILVAMSNRPPPSPEYEALFFELSEVEVITEEEAMLKILSR